MALKPIARKEKIISGEDIEPITRLEKFLKKYSVSQYFGETTTTVGGDTLTWDGNTEGLAVEQGGGELFKVSNSIPVLADFDNGMTITAFIGGQNQAATLGKESVYTINGIIFAADGICAVVPHEVAGEVINEEWLFPEAGVYFMNSSYAKVASLTIPGYTGFTTTTTVVKPIDPKYLPEALRFGTKTAPGLKITEADITNASNELDLGDGGRVMKVSDKVYTAADFAGLKIVYAYGNEEPITEENPQILEGMMPGCIGISTSDGQAVGYAMFSPLEIEAGVLTPGLWLHKFDDGAMRIISFEIPDTNFITRLDEKYMPLLTSPSGKKFKLSVDDSGTINTTEVV